MAELDEERLNSDYAYILLRDRLNDLKKLFGVETALYFRVNIGFASMCAIWDVWDMLFPKVSRLRVMLKTYRRHCEMRIWASLQSELPPFYSCHYKMCMGECVGNAEVFR